MKFTKIMVIAFALIGILLVACTPDAAKKPREVFQPDWYGEEIENDVYLFSYGNGKNINSNMSETSAKSNAMAEAALGVEAYVKTMMKNFMSEAGVENPEVVSLTEQATKVIANQKFNGTSFTKRKTYVLNNNRYKTFIQVGIPKAAVNKATMDKIKNEEALYNRFRASQSFEELDREIEKY